MIKTILSCIFLLSTGFAQLGAGRIWWHQESDLAVDKKAIFGKLENGFRYIIYPNDEPPGRLSARLHVNAGSLEEADDQQGMAHFLEHMLFEGSKNYTAAELIPEMQRLGISFGAHANAYTSFDETVYMLDLPNLEDKTVNLCFTVMRDFCDGALLETKEIEAERGVILSEKNSRDSVGSRLMKKQFEFLMPDFLASNRFPIGIEKTIKECPPERIRDFYKDFYDPMRMTFVLVGDIDPKVYEQRIKDTFGSLKSPSTEVKTPEPGSITEPEGLKIGIFTDPEVDEDDLSITRALENASHPDTLASRHADLKISIASSILSKRFSRIAKQEGSPINSGAAYKYTWFDEITFGTITVTPSEGKWKEAVPILEQEFRRALEHGFTKAEFQQATSALLTSVQQSVESFETRTSSSIASSIVSTINDREVITDAVEDLRVVEALLENLTVEDCHKAFKQFWENKGKHLTLTKKERKTDDEKTVLSLWKESQSQEVSAPEEKAVAKFAYSTFGDPSTITEERYVEDLDFHQLTLSNGIKVNIKKTDFEKGKVYVSARIGSGLANIPDLKPGLDSYASTIFNLGGLSAHSNEDLRQILSDKVAGISFGIGEDAFILSGACNQDDLETQLALLGAYLTEPGYRPEAHRLYLKSIPDQYEQLRQTLEGAMQNVNSFERGGDPRFTIPSEQNAAAFTPEDARNFIEKHMKGKAIELTILGDLNLDKTKALIQKVLGSGITADADSPKHKAALKALPNLGQKKEFHYSSKLDRAASIVSWRTSGLNNNISESRRLNLVSGILRNRMREQVREKLGASYSPYAYSEMSDTFYEFGNIKAYSQCKPVDLSTITELVIKIGNEFAENGATQDELDRVQKPAIANLENSLRQNSYWLGVVIARSQAQPKRLDWCRSRTEDYATVTLQEVNALAAKYLKPENANTFLISPKSE